MTVTMIGVMIVIVIMTIDRNNNNNIDSCDGSNNVDTYDDDVDDNGNDCSGVSDCGGNNQ